MRHLVGGVVLAAIALSMAGAKELRMVRLIGRVVECEIVDVSKTATAKNPRLRLTVAVESTTEGAGPPAGAEILLIGSGGLASACVPVGARVAVKAQLASPPSPGTLYELTRL